MSEPTETPAQTPPAPATPTPAEPPAPPTAPAAPPPIQLPDDHPLVKSLAAQKEQIRELKAAAVQSAQASDASKSDAEKLLDRVQALETERDAAKAEALKMTVASAKGVPAELISGSTQAELEAAADRLLAFKTATAPPRSATPQEAGAGKQGADVGSPKQLNREDLAKLSPEERLKAAKDGQLRDLLKA